MVSVNTPTTAGEETVLYTYEARDTSPALVRSLRQSLSGCHWEYQTRMLQILEWVCGTDRQFDHARKRALDLINGQERSMAAIVARTLTGDGRDGS